MTQLSNNTRRDYPVIDIHAHIFPAKIQEKAVASIGHFYDLSMHSDGSLDTLLSENEKAGIVCSVVFSTATAVKQVSSIHDFIGQVQNDSNGRLIGFGTLHPDMTRMEIELEISHMLALGLRGIKLHPDFQHVPADSSSVFRMAEAAEGTLPLLIHAGDYRHNFSHPEQIRTLALAFPGLTLIAAHFGGWSEWHKAPDALAGLPNVYVDTSSSLAFLSPQKARELVHLYGADHVLFGTDFPMWSASEELARLDRLSLPEKDLRKILYDNACALLSVSSFSKAT
jgi:predicted TIM-barrel fold metal-dependent hydrolase